MCPKGNKPEHCKHGMVYSWCSYCQGLVKKVQHQGSWAGPHYCVETSILSDFSVYQRPRYIPYKEHVTRIPYCQKDD